MFLIKGKYKISSPFGPRVIFGKKEMHPGVDFVPLEDQNIYNVADGTVYYSTWFSSAPDNEMGNVVCVKCDDGKYRRYQHLASRAVKAGQRIKAGDKIGVVGNTGKSTGIHCHYQVYTTRTSPSGSAVNAADDLGISNVVGIYNGATPPVKPFSSGECIIEVGVASAGDAKYFQNLAKDLKLQITLEPQSNSKNTKVIIGPASAGDQITIIEEAQRLGFTPKKYVPKDPNKGKVTITADTLNVRVDTSIYDIKIDEVHKGETYEYRAAKNGWYFIMTSAKSGGWVSGEYVKEV